MRCSLLTSDLNRFKNRTLADTVCGKGGGEEGTEGGRGGRKERRGEGRGEGSLNLTTAPYMFLTPTLSLPSPAGSPWKKNNITDLPEESWAVCCNLITERLTKTIHPWAFIRKTRREMFATEQLLDIFLAFGVLVQ